MVRKTRFYQNAFLLFLMMVSGTSFTQEVEKGMEVKTENYYSFSDRAAIITNELISKTSSLGQQHPEFGVLPSESPCTDCYELLDERTEFTRMFVRNGTNGSEILTQSAFSPLNYQKNGRWHSVDSRLSVSPNQAGVYNAPDQIAPTQINIQNEYVQLNFNGELIKYNKNLRLIHENLNGEVLTTISADWSSYTVGEEGAYVTNIFPNVDMEVRVSRGKIKTNFIMTSNLNYAEGNVVIRDDFEMSSNLKFNQIGQDDQTHIGELDITDSDGLMLFQLGEAYGYDANANKEHIGRFDYRSKNQSLDIVIPTSWLNDQNLEYPLTIDPLLTANTSILQGAITGSGYNATCFTGGCNYNMNATVPADVQITDVEWSFDYQALGFCWMSDGAITFNINGCVSPATAGFFWFCNNNNPGTCGGANISLFADVSTCMPAPQCGVSTLPCQMTFYRCFTAGGGCSGTCIGAASDWIMTVIGNTVEEPAPPTSTAAGNTICEGFSTDLSATGTFGVPPYVVSWDNGGGVGNPVTVSPTVNTTYTATITDACGNTASNTIAITVVPAPDSGLDGVVTFCPSDPNSSLLAELGGTPDGGGTWSGPSGLTGGSAGNFNPGTMNAGVYTYTVNGSAPCNNVSSTVTVTLDVLPDAGTNGAITYCPADPSSDLFAELGGTPDAGGVWSPALTSGTGVFDPGSDAAGTYTYTVTNPCGVATADVVVTIDPAPDAGTNGAITYCPADPSSDLFAELGGTPDAGGVWAPAMTSGTGVFDPGSDAAGTYTYTVTNSCGSISADVVVTIDPAPDAGTNGAITYCPADPSSDLFAELGGTPDAGGVWSPALTSGTGVFDPGSDAAGTYSYTVTNPCGVATADVVVTIDPAPDAGTNGAITYCPADPSSDLFAELGGTPDAGGVWTPAMTSGTGVFDPGSDAAGTYTYTVTNSCGNISADVVVTIDPAPDAGTNGAITYCPADPSSDLFAELGGTPDAGGVWTPAMTSGTGIFDPGSDAAGTYTYTVTNSCGSISADVVVTIDPAPDAGINGALVICFSDPSTDLFAELDGTPDAGGTWAPAMTSGTGVFDPGSDAAGTYTYTVTNSCGSISADVDVTIVNVPDAGTNGAITYCPADPSSDLFAELGGIPDIGGTWAPALTSGTGVFDPGSDAAGTYTYTVTASCGTSSADVVVTIDPAPDAGTNGAITYCPADPTSDLFAELGGTPDAGGVWTPAMTSGTGVFDPGADAAGTYTYTVTNSCGNISADVVVTIDPAPDAGTNGAITYCPADPSSDLFAELGGTPDAGGTWAPAMTSGTGVFDPGSDAAGTYTYTVTNSCGNISTDVVVAIDPAPVAGLDGAATFCPTDPASDLFTNLAGTPDAGGVWTPAMTSGTGVFDPGTDTPGTYTYTVTNSCGSESADIIVTINANPDPGTNGAISFCPTDAASDLFSQLGGTPDAGGTWTPAMTSGTGIFDPGTDPAGTYTYSLNACGGGTLTADVVVTLNPSPDAGTNGTITFCASDPTSDLFAQLGGTPDAGGTWSPALVSGSGVFDPASDITGIYTYSVTNACGTATAEVDVTVDPCIFPVAEFSISDSVICIGECVNLIDESTGDPTSWDWDFGGAATPNTSTDNNPSICPTTVGTFTISLTVTNSNGTSTTTHDLMVNAIPTVDAGLDTTVDMNTEALLTGEFTPPGGTTSWTGDGDIFCPSCGATYVTPIVTTYYTFSYTTIEGCSASDSVRVTVLFEDLIDVPNGFSPNGDGNNELLFVKGEGIKYMNFVVYNRYGQKVFETFEQNIGWDGYFKGSPENPGVFLWYLKYTLLDGTSNTKQGNVTLLK